MFAWRIFGGEPAKEFFARKPFEAVPHEIAVGDGTVEAIGVSEDEADAGVGADKRED